MLKKWSSSVDTRPGETSQDIRRENVLKTKKEKHKKIHKFKKPKAMVATWSDDDSSEKEEEEKSSSFENEKICFMVNSSDGKARSTLPSSSVDTLQPRSTITSSSVDTYLSQGDSSRGHRLRVF
ncbi:hypothetical protein Taro_027407 [Colocasia esculenta]|uniref:Uncharacterized protein n=1 Tax=Colocasia esculenta TaxID=4460 RepID=A0A843VRG5_COLES|nr:hypothetical protein [Colocasia esculenta]